MEKSADVELSFVILSTYLKLMKFVFKMSKW